MVSSKPRTDAWVWIVDADDTYEPPSEPGLMISAVHDRVFLSIEKQENPDGKTTTFTKVAEVQVELTTLLKGILTVIDAQQFDTVFSLLPKAVRGE